MVLLRLCPQLISLLNKSIPMTLTSQFHIPQVFCFLKWFHDISFAAPLDWNNLAKGFFATIFSLCAYGAVDYLCFALSRCELTCYSSHPCPDPLPCWATLFLLLTIRQHLLLEQTSSRAILPTLFWSLSGAFIFLGVGSIALFWLITSACDCRQWVKSCPVFICQYCEIT